MAPCRARLCLPNLDANTANVYVYAIPDGMTLQSLTLPRNPNSCRKDAGSCTPAPSVSILGISLL